MQHLKFRGFKLFHQNLEAAEAMIREIERFPSFFTPTSERPWIIDCGANIGVSVLEWKTRWPQSRIICFEPGPSAFDCLQRTIEVNDIPDVQCIQAAVSERDEIATLFGDHRAAGDGRGNSLDPAWGDRGASDRFKVRCQRLSPHLVDRQVDFLKLDIEGSELRVLEEIAAHLGNVSALYVEVHQTNENQEYNSVTEIDRTLRREGFRVEVQPRDPAYALPASLRPWQRAVDARQTQLLAWR